MPLLSGHDLEKAYGDRTILAGVSVTLEEGERVGLVGANGSGKTTLARILAGVSEADAGEVRRTRGRQLGYLEQAPEMDPALSAIDVVLSGLQEYVAALHRYEEITAQLEAMDSSKHGGLLREQEKASETIERLGGWDLRHRAAAVLGHLKISDIDRAVGTMSGGERRRVALARILVAEPDLAVLDEPTNHLDIPTIEWLERYLIDRYRGGVLLITHDRYLLDRVVSRTLEVERGELHSFEGAWQEYLEARALRAAQEARVESNRQNFLRRELEWLRRQPKARTGKQKARIGRAEAAIAIDRPRAESAAAVSVKAARSGKTILEARELRVEIGGAVLVKDFEITLTAGQRVGVIGANGAGKTTLLRTLLGKHEPSAGTVKLGSNTKIAYLDQARAGLDLSATVYDNVAQGASHVTLGDRQIEMRQYLYRFLFDNSGQKQPVGSLSGGERARVALARVLREKANLVVLDEPTNDLDATTLSALEAALLEFGGTSIVVTHDRWFLDRVATHLISFEGDGEVVVLAGNYSDYVRWKKAREADAEAEAKATTKKASKPADAVKPTGKTLTYGEEIELGGLMEKIEAAEAEVAALETETTAEAFHNRDYKEQADRLEALQQARDAADALVERWSDLSARSEG